MNPTPVHELDLAAIDPYRPAPEILAVTGGAWLARAGDTPVVCGHAEARELLKDRRLHHLLRHLDEVRGSDAKALQRREGSLLSAEGDEHRRLRRLCLGAFKRRRIEELRPRIAATARQWIDRFAPDGRAELVGELCEPYPVQVIAEVLGASGDDWHLFARWATDLLGVFTARGDELARIETSQNEMTAYVTDLIERRRDEPGDDLLSDLITAESEGDRLSTTELVTLAEAILTGGSDTTRNQLAITVNLLLGTGRWSDVVADPGLVPAVVEEVLRHTGTVRQTARVAVDDVVYRDVLFPAGSVIAFSFAAANADPAVFGSDPGLDFAAERPPHLTFGSGIHFCLGAWLARTELEEALATLAATFPDLRADGPTRWRPRRSTFLALTELPVAFTPRDRAETSAIQPR